MTPCGLTVRNCRNISRLSDTVRTNGEKLKEHFERVYFIKTKTIALQPEVSFKKKTKKMIKVQQPPYSLDRPSGFQEVQAPILQDKSLTKLARLSVLPTDHLYPRKYSWYSFLLWTV